MLMSISDSGKEFILEFETMAKGRQFWNLMTEVKQAVGKEESLDFIPPLPSKAVASILFRTHGRTVQRLFLD